jgi:hypothetical protein
VTGSSQEVISIKTQFLPKKWKEDFERERQWDKNFWVVQTSWQQGCQILLGSRYQNGENIPNDHKIFSMPVK